MSISVSHSDKYEMVVFWDVMPCSMVDINTSEELTVSTNIYQIIQHNIPADSQLQ
jgi:hypothetical protein